MGFFSKLINTIRGINAGNKPAQSFAFGSIISGTYTNWKTDPHPTILCLGNYNRNGRWYVHGIQLHAIGNDLQWMLSVITNIKNGGVVTTPQMFYNYIRLNRPSVIATSYRTYLSGMCDFKTVAPGFSMITADRCYPPSDGRDGFLDGLKQAGVAPVNRFPVDPGRLRESITAVINTVKVWR